MSGLAFFDLPEEQNRGIALFAEPLQVLEEYFAAATRKLGLSAEMAQRKVEKRTAESCALGERT